MVKFILLLVLDIPAVFISLVIFIYCLSHRRICSKPKNHVWLLLLTFNFLQLLINLPMPMSFYYLTRIWPATNAYCVWWTWYEYSFNAASLILMAWASGERHLFVFYPRLLLGASWKKWIYHFVPLGICILFPAVWYLVLVVISSNCVNKWYFDQVICGVPCFSSVSDGIYGVFDLVFNIVLPLVIIIVCNMTLIVRVVYEKISRRQVVNWRRHRRMAFQLWFISSLYLIGWMPFTITNIIQRTFAPSFMLNELGTIYFFVYFIPLFFPYVCLGALPEIVFRIRKVFRRQQQNQIGT